MTYASKVEHFTRHPDDAGFTARIIINAMPAIRECQRRNPEDCRYNPNMLLAITASASRQP